MEQISLIVWANSAALLVVMVVITALALRQLRDASTKSVIVFGAAWFLTCIASGLVVRALVGWQVNTPSSYVVPGPVPTWLPATAALAYAAVAVARQARLNLPRSEHAI